MYSGLGLPDVVETVGVADPQTGQPGAHGGLGHQGSEGTARSAVRLWGTDVSLAQAWGAEVMVALEMQRFQYGRHEGLGLHQPSVQCVHTF